MKCVMQKRGHAGLEPQHNLPSVRAADVETGTLGRLAQVQSNEERMNEAFVCLSTRMDMRMRRKL